MGAPPAALMHFGRVIRQSELAPNVAGGSAQKVPTRPDDRSARSIHAAGSARLSRRLMNRQSNCFRSLSFHLWPPVAPLFVQPARRCPRRSAAALPLRAPAMIYYDDDDYYFVPLSSSRRLRMQSIWRAYCLLSSARLPQRESWRPSRRQTGPLIMIDSSKPDEAQWAPLASGPMRWSL